MSQRKDFGKSRTAPIQTGADASLRTGVSTNQIRNAPAGAIYVCPSMGVQPYYVELMRKVGRGDLRFVSPEFLDRNLAGTMSPVILDHATRLTEAQHLTVIQHNAMLRPR